MNNSVRQNLQDNALNLIELYQWIVENNLQTVTLASSEGKIVFASPNLEKLLGYSWEEVKNRPTFDLLCGEDIEKVSDVYHEVIGNPGVPFAMTARFKTKKGGSLATEGTITNLLHRKGINAIVISCAA